MKPTVEIDIRRLRDQHWAKGLDFRSTGSLGNNTTIFKCPGNSNVKQMKVTWLRLKHNDKREGLKMKLQERQGDCVQDRGKTPGMDKQRSLPRYAVVNGTVLPAKFVKNRICRSLAHKKYGTIPLQPIFQVHQEVVDQECKASERRHPLDPRY